MLSVTLAGGEPFIREDFRELIDGIVAHRMRFSVLSNGTLVTDDLAAFLAASGRCDMVQVSVDGSEASIHDTLRGRGSFEKAMEGIRCLQRHGVPVGVRVTVHRDNVDDLERIASLLLDDLGLPDFSTNAASHMGLCRTNEDSVQLGAVERSRAMQMLVDLTQRYPGRITADAGPLAEAYYYTAMEQARLEGLSGLPGKGCLTGCGCVHSKLAVRADGVMVPCNLLSQIELGRINQDSLFDIWLGHPVLQAMRIRHTIPLAGFAYCEGCPYVRYCTGNCPALSYTVFGCVDHPSPDGCLRRFLAEGGSLPLMRNQPAGKSCCFINDCDSIET